MVWALISTLKGFVKAQSVTIDNGAFRLHYRITAGLFAVACLFTTATQYFGDPIACVEKKSVDKDVLNNFCWANSTYSIQEEFHQPIGDKVIYHGIGNGFNKTEKFHFYYQWVPFVLFLEACIFYFPRFLWKAWEGDKVKTLVQGLKNPLLTDEEKTGMKNRLIIYMQTHMNQHRFYFVSYCAIEVFNFVNVISQIYILDVFLGGEFRQFGLKVIKHTLLDTWEMRTDPLTQIFPKLTKCRFYIFGSTSEAEKLDTLCVLPLNVINEKIFVFSWFWFVILATIAAAVLVYRLFIYFSASCRTFVLKSHSPFCNRQAVKEICHSLDRGDWFLVYLLSKNMEPKHFSEMLEELHNKLGSGGYYNNPIPNMNQTLTMPMQNAHYLNGVDTERKFSMGSFNKDKLIDNDITTV